MNRLKLFNKNKIVSPPTPGPEIKEKFKQENIILKNNCKTYCRNDNPIYSLKDIIIIEIDQLPENKSFNACLIDNNRLFFRSYNKIFFDKLYTVLLDENFKCVPNTLKQINVISKFENDVHVEDPRVIIHKNNYFMSYTDGYTIAVAKLDLEFNVIYSHYLKKHQRFESMHLLYSMKYPHLGLMHLHYLMKHPQQLNVHHAYLI